MFKETPDRRILGMNRRKMSEVHEIENDIEKVSYKWGAKTKSNIIIRYVKTHMGETPEKDMEATYDYIHDKMVKDGSNEQEIREFVERNKDILAVSCDRLDMILNMFENQEQSDRVFYNYTRLLTRKIPLSRFYSAIKSLDEEFGYTQIETATRTENVKPMTRKETASKETMEETYQFVLDKFMIDGFNEEEARKFINENIEILQLPKSRIMSELAILSIASLQDKAFYEHTDLITSMPPLSRIYGAIHSRLGKRIYIADIKKYLKKSPAETVTYDGELTKEKLILFYQSYKNKFEILVNEEHQKRVL